MRKVTESDGKYYISIPHETMMGAAKVFSNLAVLPDGKKWEKETKTFSNFMFRVWKAVFTGRRNGTEHIFEIKPEQITELATIVNRLLTLTN